MQSRKCGCAFLIQSDIYTHRERERERERGRVREREGERGRKRERGCVRKRERKRCRIWLLYFYFHKGMRGALAPFSYLVIHNKLECLLVASNVSLV